jgi:predicted DNA-binding protein with PD1-like motif
MQYSTAKLGRIFVVRLEDHDRLDECIQELSQKERISRAAVILVGGADQGSRLVVGPKDGRAQHIEPMQHLLNNVHEIAGVGTIFPNEDGEPVLHMHAACGREGETRTGCVRGGVDIWHVGEVIVFELADNQAVRRRDKMTGFELLEMK